MEIVRSAVPSDFHESATFWKVSLSYIRGGGRRGGWEVGPFRTVLLSRRSNPGGSLTRHWFRSSRSKAQRSLPLPLPAKKGSTGFGFIARRWIPKKACRFPPSRQVPSNYQPTGANLPTSLFHFHLSLSPRRFQIHAWLSSRITGAISRMSVYTWIESNIFISPCMWQLSVTFRYCVGMTCHARRKYLDCRKLQYFSWVLRKFCIKTWPRRNK